MAPSPRDSGSGGQMEDIWTHMLSLKCQRHPRGDVEQETKWRLELREEIPKTRKAACHICTAGGSNWAAQRFRGGSKERRDPKSGSQNSRRLAKEALGRSGQAERGLEMRMRPGEKTQVQKQGRVGMGVGRKITWYSSWSADVKRKKETATSENKCGSTQHQLPGKLHPHSQAAWLTRQTAPSGPDAPSLHAFDFTSPLPTPVPQSFITNLCLPTTNYELFYDVMFLNLGNFGEHCKNPWENWGHQRGDPSPAILVFHKLSDASDFTIKDSFLWLKDLILY